MLRIFQDMPDKSYHLMIVAFSQINSIPYQQ